MAKRLPRLPKSTRINGERWRVRPRRQVTVDGEEVAGACHYDSKLLEISVASENEFYILQTYWHEILHACFEASGVQSISDDAEHALLRVIETYLAANVDIREKPRKNITAVTKKSEAKKRIKARSI